MDSKDAKFFYESIDIAVATNYPKKTILKVHKMCREDSKSETKLFAGDIFEYFGYFFMDFSMSMNSLERSVTHSYF